MTTIVLAGCLPALAQTSPPRVEAAQNRREVRTDRQVRRDDLRDVAKLTALAKRHDAARTAKDAKALSAVRVEMRNAAMVELQEGRPQIVRAASEVARDGAEVRSDRRKAVQTASVGGPSPSDEATLKNDKADRRDDVRDLAARQRIQDRRREIANDLRNMPTTTNDAQNTHERAVLSELIALAKLEASGDFREVREDRQEKAEDRIKN